MQGVTLLELLVTLVLMGIVATLVVPSLSPPREGGATLGAVVRAARGAAIARGQLLSLTVQANGAWAVHPLPPDDAQVLLGGQLDAAPASALRLQLTPMGTCLAASPLPPAFGGWDAAGCTPLATAMPRAE